MMRCMNASRVLLPTRFRALAQGLPLDNAVRIEVEEGLPVLRVMVEAQDADTARKQAQRLADAARLTV